MTIRTRSIHVPRCLRTGFTLVELLVVIAILVVLAALVFLGARKGMESARSAQCSNNMRALVTRHILLSEENNGVIVHAWKAKPFGSWNRNWSDFQTIAAFDEINWRSGKAKVIPLMKTVSDFQCPTAYLEQRKAMASHDNHNGWRTYAMNQRLGAISDPGDSQYNWIDGAERILQVEAPEQLVFLGEKAWNGSRYPGAFGPVAGTETYADFHGGHCHVAYFDGHVERVRPEEIPVQGTQLPSGETVKMGGASNVESSLIWRGRRNKRP